MARTPKGKSQSPDTTGDTSPRRAPVPISPIPNHPKLTQARIDAILEEVRQGMALYKACEKAGISDFTWYKACADTAWLDLASTRARECRADRYAAEVLEVSRGEGAGAGMPADERRILVDSLKWTSARMAPKRWGDRVQVEATVEPVAGAAARDQAAALLAQAAALRERLAR